RQALRDAAHPRRVEAEEPPSRKTQPPEITRSPDKPGQTVFFRQWRKGGRGDSEAVARVQGPGVYRPGNEIVIDTASKSERSFVPDWRRSHVNRLDPIDAVDIPVRVIVLAHFQNARHPGHRLVGHQLPVRPEDLDGFGNRRGVAKTASEHSVRKDEA